MRILRFVVAMCLIPEIPLYRFLGSSTSSPDKVTSSGMKALWRRMYPEVLPCWIDILNAFQMENGYLLSLCA